MPENPNQKKKAPRYDASVARVVDDELQKLGWSPNARLSFLGDLGRENGWNRNVIFGGHADPKNGATNRGIVSWQGDRRANLNRYLKNQGLLGKSDDNELRGMVRFMDDEMRGSNEWKRTHSAMRDPNISTAQASENLRKYIKYSTDPKYNTPDPEFRVKNNRDWAMRAKQLGLGGNSTVPINSYAGNVTPVYDVPEVTVSAPQSVPERFYTNDADKAAYDKKVAMYALKDKESTLFSQLAKAPTLEERVRLRKEIKDLSKQYSEMEKGVLPLAPLPPTNPVNAPTSVTPPMNIETVTGVDATAAPQMPSMQPQNVDWQKEYKDYAQYQQSINAPVATFEDFQKLVNETNATEGQATSFQPQSVVGVQQVPPVTQSASKRTQSPQGAAVPNNAAVPQSTATYDNTASNSASFRIDLRKGDDVRKKLTDSSIQYLTANYGVTAEDAERAVNDFPIKFADGSRATDTSLQIEADNNGFVEHEIMPSVIKRAQAYKQKRLEFEQKSANVAQRVSKGENQLDAQLQEGLINQDQYNAAQAEIKKAQDAEAEARKRFEAENPQQYQPMVTPSGDVIDTPYSQQTSKEKLDEILAKYGSATQYYKEQRLKMEAWKKIAENPNAFAKEFGTNLLRAIPKAASSVAKTISIGAEGIDSGLKALSNTTAGNLALGAAGNWYANTQAQDVPAEQRGFYQVGQTIDRITDEYLPQDELLKRNFLATVLPDTVGQLLVQLGVGVVTGGAAAPLSLGISQGASAQYEEAGKFGADRKTKLLSAFVGGLLAAPEALLFTKWLAPLNAAEKTGFFSKLFNSFFRKAAEEVGEKEAVSVTRQLMKNALVGGGGESTQEVIENKGNDLFASLTYDKKRKVLVVNDEDIESVLAGFIGGAVGGGVETAGQMSQPQMSKEDVEKAVAEEYKNAITTNETNNNGIETPAPEVLSQPTQVAQDALVQDKPVESTPEIPKVKEASTVAKSATTETLTNKERLSVEKPQHPLKAKEGMPVIEEQKQVRKAEFGDAVGNQAIMDAQEAVQARVKDVDRESKQNTANNVPVYITAVQHLAKSYLKNGGITATEIDALKYDPVVGRMLQGLGRDIMVAFSGMDRKLLSELSSVNIADSNKDDNKALFAFFSPDAIRAAAKRITQEPASAIPTKDTSVPISQNKDTKKPESTVKKQNAVNDLSFRDGFAKEVLRITGKFPHVLTLEEYTKAFETINGYKTQEGNLIVKGSYTEHLKQAVRDGITLAPNIQRFFEENVSASYRNRLESLKVATVGEFYKEKATGRILRVVDVDDGGVIQLTADPKEKVIYGISSAKAFLTKYEQIPNKKDLQKNKKTQQTSAVDAKPQEKAAEKLQASDNALAETFANLPNVERKGNPPTDAIESAKAKPKGGATKMSNSQVQYEAADSLAPKLGVRADALYEWAKKTKTDLLLNGHFLLQKTADARQAVINGEKFIITQKAKDTSVTFTRTTPKAKADKVKAAAKALVAKKEAVAEPVKETFQARAEQAISDRFADFESGKSKQFEFSHYTEDEYGRPIPSGEKYRIEAIAGGKKYRVFKEIAPKENETADESVRRALSTGSRTQFERKPFKTFTNKDDAVAFVHSIALGNSTAVSSVKETPKTEPVTSNVLKESEKGNTKEPWQMTRKEFNETSAAKGVGTAWASRAHKNAVAEAVLEGKDVPQNVRNEYPDIQTVVNRKAAEKGRAAELKANDDRAEASKRTKANRLKFQRSLLSLQTNGSVNAKNIAAISPYQLTADEFAQAAEIKHQELELAREYKKYTDEYDRLKANETYAQTLKKNKTVATVTAKPANDNYLLTKQEYLDKMKVKRGAARELAEFDHEQAIKKALSENKPVPAEVLADYPDLAKKATNKESATVADGGKDVPHIINERFKGMPKYKIKPLETKTIPVKDIADTRLKRAAKVSEKSGKPYYFNLYSGASYEFGRYIHPNEEWSKNHHSYITVKDGIVSVTQYHFGDRIYEKTKKTEPDIIPPPTNGSASKIKLAPKKAAGEQVYQDARKAVNDFRDARIAKYGDDWMDKMPAKDVERWRILVQRQNTAAIRPESETLKQIPDTSFSGEAYEKELASIKVEKDADGNLLAPNGKKSNLPNERTWKMVRTENFKKWFGDWEVLAKSGKTVWEVSDVSKAVDENGEPIILHHGTPNGGFTIFDAESHGKKVAGATFFTSDSGMARSYSGTYDTFNDKGWRDAGYEVVEEGRDWVVYTAEGDALDYADSQADAERIAQKAFEAGGADGRATNYEVFLNIREPYETDFEGANWDGDRSGYYVAVNEDGEILYNDKGEGYFYDYGDAQDLADAKNGEVEDAPYHYETTDEAAREGIASGDGAIIRNVQDSGSQGDHYGAADVYVVSSPNQIKSATGNSGAFSSQDDSILKQIADDGEISIDSLSNKNGELNYDKIQDVAGRIERGEYEIGRLDRRSEQGRIRGGRRNVEASLVIGASESTVQKTSTSNGERVESLADTVKRQERVLEQYAKRNDIWFKQGHFPERLYLGRGGESIVYQKDENRVVKLVDYRQIDKSMTPLRFIDSRISAFNALFPASGYELSGFMQDQRGNLRFVLTQPLIQGTPIQDQSVTDAAMLKRGLVRTGKESYSNSLYEVHDIHNGNVLADANGTVFVIDAVPKIKNAPAPFGIRKAGRGEDGALKQIAGSVESSKVANPILQAALNYDNVEDFIKVYQRRAVGDKDAHAAPSFDDTPVDERLDDGGDFNLEEVAKGQHNQPSDYFDERVGAKYYMYDNPQGQESATALRNVFRGLKAGKEGVTITAYRAVPSDLNLHTLVNGDWITFSKSYAEGHGEHRFDGEYKLIKQEVRPQDVWWDGNDINEWGFDTGKDLTRQELEQIYQDAQNSGTLNKITTADQSPDKVALSELAAKESFTDDDLKQIEVETDGDVVTLSLMGGELVRTADELMTKGTRSKTSQAAGQFLKPSDVTRIADGLDILGETFEENGQSRAELDAVRDAILEAAKGDGSARLQVYKSALPHETRHKVSWKFDKSESKVLANRVHNLPGFVKANQEIIDKAFNNFFKKHGYTESQAPTLVEELWAYTSTGDYERLGLSDAEAADYVVNWLQAYEKQHGEDALNDLVKFIADQEDAQDIIERANDAKNKTKEEQNRADGKGISEEQKTSDSQAKGNDAETLAADEENRRLSADGELTHADNVKQRQYAETLRENGRTAYQDTVDYVPESEKGWTANAKKIIEDSRAANPADPYRQAIDEFNNSKQPESFRAVLGVALIDHLGADGMYDEMRKIADSTVKVVGTAGQALRASQIVSKYDFAKGIEIAQKGLKQAGMELTDDQIDEVKRKTMRYAAAADNEAVNTSILEEIKTELEHSENRIKELETAYSELSDDNEKKIKDLAEAKKQGRIAKRLATYYKNIVENGRQARTRAAAPKAVREELAKTKDADVQLLRDLFGDSAVLKMVAWHGSPHVFDKFSLDKIGTGEGAQAYGHGLYFTDREDVADWYKTKLSATKTHIEYETRRIDTLIADTERRIQREEQALESIQADGSGVARLVEDIQLLKSQVASLKKDRDELLRKSGAKYKVDLKPAEDEYLLWDKPLSEQSEKVKDFFQEIQNATSYYYEYDGNPVGQILLYQNEGAYLSVPERGAARVFDNYDEALNHLADNTDASNLRHVYTDHRYGGLFQHETLTGSEVVEALDGLFQSPKTTSEYLKSLGIRGIKYLDGTSRNKGEGSYNYVIFDDSDVEILETLKQIAPESEKPLTPEQRAALVRQAQRSIVAENPVSYDDLMKQLAQITHGQVSENTLRSIHAEAVNGIKRDAVDVEGMDEKTRAAYEKQKAVRKARSEHRSKAKAFERSLDAKSTLSPINRKIIAKIDAKPDLSADDKKKLITATMLSANVAGAKAWNEGFTEAYGLTQSENNKWFVKAVEMKKELRNDIKREQMGERAKKANWEGSIPQFENTLLQAQKAKRDAQRSLDAHYRELQKKRWERVVDKILFVPDLMRTLMSTGEVSQIGRQGYPTLLTFPKAWTKSLKGLQTGLGNQTQRFSYIKAIEADPDFQESVRYGMPYATFGENAVGDEHFPIERMMTRLSDKDYKISKLPVVGTVLSKAAKAQMRFEHAYTDPADLQRLGVYKAFKSIIDSQSLTDDQADTAKKRAVYYAKILSGKGSLPSLFGERSFATRMLASLGFAPNLLASRVETVFHFNPILAPVLAPKGLKTTMVKKSLQLYTVPAVLALALSAIFKPTDDDDKDASYLDVLNPMSKRFLKVTIRGTDINLDVSSGMGDFQRVMFYDWANLIYSGIKDGKDGFVNTAMNLAKNEQNSFLSAKFLRGKLSPIASLGVDVTTGSDFVGHPINWEEGGYWGAVTSRMTPLTYQHIYDALFYDEAYSLTKEPQTATAAKEKLSRFKMANILPAMALGTLEAVGLSANQYEKVNNSAAVDTAWTLYSKNFEAKNPQLSRVKTELRNLFRKRDTLERAGKDTSGVDKVIDELKAKYEMVTPKDIATIKEQVRQGKFDFVTKQMDATQIRQIMQVATDAEKVELQKILDKKLGNGEKKETKTDKLRAIADKLTKGESVDTSGLTKADRTRILSFMGKSPLEQKAVTMTPQQLAELWLDLSDEEKETLKPIIQKKAKASKSVIVKDKYLELLQ